MVLFVVTVLTGTKPRGGGLSRDQQRHLLRLLGRILFILWKLLANSGTEIKQASETGTLHRVTSKKKNLKNVFRTPYFQKS